MIRHKWVRDSILSYRKSLDLEKLEPAQTGDKIWVYCKVTECWYKVEILDTYYENETL